MGYLGARHGWHTLVLLAIQEAEVGRIKVQGQPGQRVLHTASQPTCQAWWLTSLILVMVGGIGRRITVQG
jgi:hypothetical protein